MDARKRVVKLGIRLLNSQQINAGGCNRLQSSRDSVNFYSSMSSNSSGHLLANREISLVEPIGQRVSRINEIQNRLDATISECRSAIRNSQMRHFAMVERELEKPRNYIEKLHDDLSHEIWKAAAELRNEQKAHIEAAKYVFIKYCICVPVSLSALAIGMICIFATEE